MADKWHLQAAWNFHFLFGNSKQLFCHFCATLLENTEAVLSDSLRFREPVRAAHNLHEAVHAADIAHQASVAKRAQEISRLWVHTWAFVVRYVGPGELGRWRRWRHRRRFCAWLLGRRLGRRLRGRGGRRDGRPGEREVEEPEQKLRLTPAGGPDASVLARRPRPSRGRVCVVWPVRGLWAVLKEKGPVPMSC